MRVAELLFTSAFDVAPPASRCINSDSAGRHCGASKPARGSTRATAPASTTSSSSCAASTCSRKLSAPQSKASGCFPTRMLSSLASWFASSKAGTVPLFFCLVFRNTLRSGHHGKVCTDAVSLRMRSAGPQVAQSHICGFALAGYDARVDRMLGRCLRAGKPMPSSRIRTHSTSTVGRFACCFHMSLTPARCQTDSPCITPYEALWLPCSPNQALKAAQYYAATSTFPTASHSLGARMGGAVRVLEVGYVGACLKDDKLGHYLWSALALHQAHRIRAACFATGQRVCSSLFVLPDLRFHPRRLRM